MACMIESKVLCNVNLYISGSDYVNGEGSGAS